MLLLQLRRGRSAAKSTGVGRGRHAHVVGRGRLELLLLPVVVGWWWVSLARRGRHALAKLLLLLLLAGWRGHSTAWGRWEGSLLPVHCARAVVLCIAGWFLSVCVGELEPLPLDPSALVLDCDQGDIGRPKIGRKSHVIPRGV